MSKRERAVFKNCYDLIQSVWKWQQAQFSSLFQLWLKCVILSDVISILMHKTTQNLAPFVLGHINMPSYIFSRTPNSFLHCFFAQSTMYSTRCSLQYSIYPHDGTRQQLLVVLWHGSVHCYESTAVEKKLIKQVQLQYLSSVADINAGLSRWGWQQLP